MQKVADGFDSVSRQLRLVEFDKNVSDSLVRLLNDASSYIRTVRERMGEEDKNGEKLNVAEKILIGTPQGDSLFYYVMAVYDAGIMYGDSTLRRELTPLRKTDKGKWLDQYFRRIPNYAAKTILSKFQNDLRRISMDIGAMAPGH